MFAFIIYHDTWMAFSGTIHFLKFIIEYTHEQSTVEMDQHVWSHWHNWQGPSKVNFQLDANILWHRDFSATLFIHSCICISWESTEQEICFILLESLFIHKGTSIQSHNLSHTPRNVYHFNSFQPKGMCTLLSELFYCYSCTPLLKSFKM